MVNFIGVGAQKAGTSWVYACLYEHPEICAPIKEIHFFSRPRFEKGREWYEAHFKRCEEGKKKGEFSTSYLYSKEAPERIKSLYPDAKLIAILRNPVDRAYSEYRNAIKAGHISEEKTFEIYVKEGPSCIEQGRYAEQLERYHRHFTKEQILVLIYEDSKRDPEAFIRRIYEFLGVDPNFTPTMLHHKINVARTPKHVFVERVMHHIAEFLRRIGFDKLVWAVRKSGLPDLVRKVNTKEERQESTVSPKKEAVKAEVYREDVERLSKMIDRDMVSVWRLGQ